MPGNATRSSTELSAGQYLQPKPPAALATPTPPYNELRLGRSSTELCADRAERRAGRPRAGMICTRCSPLQVAQDAIFDARSICMREYATAPEVTVYGDPNFTFAYVPSHLHHMTFELVRGGPGAGGYVALHNMLSGQLCPDGLLSGPGLVFGHTLINTVSPMTRLRKLSRLCPSMSGFNWGAPRRPAYVLPLACHQHVGRPHEREAMSQQWQRLHAGAPQVKNSLRAVNDRYEDAEDEPPPVRVVVAEGTEDVCIKARRLLGHAVWCSGLLPMPSCRHVRCTRKPRGGGAADLRWVCILR